MSLIFWMTTSTLAGETKDGGREYQYSRPMSTRDWVIVGCIVVGSLVGLGCLVLL